MRQKPPDPSLPCPLRRKLEDKICAVLLRSVCICCVAPQAHSAARHTLGIKPLVIEKLLKLRKLKYIFTAQIFIFCFYWVFSIACLECIDVGQWEQLFLWILQPTADKIVTVICSYINTLQARGNCSRGLTFNQQT